MMLRTISLKVSAAVLVASLASSAAFAQDVKATETAQDAKVPVKELGPVEAKSPHAFNTISMLRGLPDGSLFVNDGQRRQLIKLDASLQKVTVIADTAGAPLPYGQRSSGLLSYLGDSTIIVDPSTLSFVVLNAQGAVVKVMAPPRISDINALSNMNLGSNAFDPMGRLVYKNTGGGGGPGGLFGNGGGRGGGNPGGQGGAQGGRGGGGGGLGGGGFGGGLGGAPAGTQPANAAVALRPPTAPAQPDSVPIIRADFDTRKADTVAWMRVPKTDISVTTGADGVVQMTAKVNPLPQGDDWALLNDGTIAVVRVIDYHVDYYAPNGTRTASGKLPFDWRRITDDDKTKLVDSLKLVAKAVTARQNAQNAGPNPPRMRTSFEPVAPEKLPDYYPPIRANTTIADRDGNLWLLPATSSIAAQLAQQMGGPGGFGGGFGGFGGDNGGRGGRGGDRGFDRSGDRGGGAGGAVGAGGAATAGGGRGGNNAGRDTAATRRDTMPPPALPPFQLVYDVVNRKGELVERIKLPANRQIAGFGNGGVVYLSYREGRNTFIEKARRLPN